MLKVLDVEGAVARDGTPLASRRRAATGRYDAERYAHVTALRRREQEAMAAFGADGRCLMRALQEELDDPDAGGLRALRGLHRRRASTGRSTRRSCARRRCTCARARSCSRSRRWRPTPRARCARSPRTCAPRRAARSRGSATAAGTRWCRPGRRDGRFDDELVGGRRRGRARAGARRCAWVAAVPSRAQRRRWCPDFAQRLAAALGLPFAPLLERAGDRPPQREMANSAQQVANVRGAFAVAGDAAGRRRACSSTTSASAAGRWRWSPASCAARAPAPVYPLAP